HPRVPAIDSDRARFTMGTRSRRIAARSAVNREEAEKALGIIRTVIQNTREDLVAHNWGLLWMINAFTNAAPSRVGWSLEWYLEREDESVVWYLIALAAAGTFNIVTVLLLAERDHGVRSYVQWQIHGIWVTFIVFTAAFAVVMHVGGVDPRLFGSVFAMTSGMSFAMMGVVFSRQFPFAFLFLAVILAGPYLPGVQGGLIAVLWWAAMFLPGLSMHREKRRRAHDATATRLL